MTVAAAIEDIVTLTQFTAALCGPYPVEGLPVFQVGGKCICEVRDGIAKRTSPWMWNRKTGDTISIVVTVTKDQKIDVEL